MKINWFPGHMAKALTEMQKELKKIDVILYVIDSRIPFACLNPEFDKMIQDKPIILVLNKIDLADKQKIIEVKNKLLQYFVKNKIQIVELNSVAGRALNIIVDKINILCGEKIKRNREKGINSFIRGMVIGVPNCGKSSLVNNLCGKAKAITGDRAGVTKGKQWVTVDKNIQILDTPGTLYPNLENQRNARFLAYVGSIRDEVVDVNEMALDFISDINKQYPLALNVRYTIEASENSLETLELIAKSRKFVVKGGDIDYDRTCFMILDDFRKSRLGEITLI